MQVPFFDLTRQNKILEQDYQEIFSRFLEGGQAILGEQVMAFEQEFAEYVGSKYCITCGNATDALEMALRVLGIGYGHEVIVPAFGWTSVVTAVLTSGATPVFIDVMHDGNMDPQLIKSSINQKTRAVIPIHLYGHPCEIREIRSVCRSNNLFLIEDCAQAHGARVEGVHVGNFGQIGVFSFYPTKNLGALGDGGALITNDEKTFNALKELRDYGRDSAGRFQTPGRNSRMDELQAAILRKKLSFLDQWIGRRKEIAGQYNQVLGSYIDTEVSVWYKYVLTTPQRSGLIQKLNQSGIGTGIYYPFTLDSLSYLPSRKSPAPMANRLSNTTLSLPLFPEMTKEEISYICEVLMKPEISSL